MKKYIILLLYIIFLMYLLPLGITTYQQTKGADTFLFIKNNLIENNTVEPEEIGWNLVFMDDFNSSSVDPVKWEVLNREENYNNELQAYRSGNVKVQDGRLFLTGLKEGSKYSSGLVQTKGKFDLLYGKIEIKGKYPVGKGLFPAMWLLRSDGEDHLPEIDIFEVVGHEPEKAYMVHHWRDNGNLKTAHGTARIKDIDRDHLYGLEWTPEEIRWYVDNKLVFELKNHHAHVPMYLIINLAIGGNWPGNPDKKTVFPAEFSIDYVKIYQKGTGHDGSI
ncbi:MAG TPA: laminarinase [Bacillus bacterium]|nr:laminarinase [Bacillus sp. (in: firmicutes)]